MSDHIYQALGITTNTMHDHHKSSEAIGCFCLKFKSLQILPSTVALKYGAFQWIASGWMPITSLNHIGVEN